ncbi:MAG: DMT family transporter [bacterium]
MKHLNNKYSCELSTLLASLLWGSSFTAIKIGLDQIDPLWFVQWRMFFASLLLLPIFVRKWNPKKYFANKKIWLLGVTNAAAYLCQFIGMQFTTASAAAFYVNLSIVFTALLSFFILNEHFNKAKLFGLVLAIVGMLLLSTNGKFHLLTHYSTLGGLLVVISGFFWALYTVLTKKLLTNKIIHFAPLTATILFFSSMLLMLPALIWGNWPEAVSVRNGGILTYLVVFCTVLPFLFWAKGLKGISATVSAALLLTEPIFTIFIAYPILGELFETIEALGATIILIALGLISFDKSQNGRLS